MVKLFHKIALIKQNKEANKLIKYLYKINWINNGDHSFKLQQCNFNKHLKKSIFQPIYSYMNAFKFTVIKIIRNYLSN